MRLHDVEINEAELAAFCGANGIRELLFFGSITRPTFGTQSDVDVLVRIEPGRIRTLLEFAGLQERLSLMLGRAVHLHTDDMLPPKHRDYFLRGAVRGYAA